MSYQNRNPYYRRPARRYRVGLILALVAVFALLVLAGVGCSSYYKDSSVTIAVTGKEAVPTDSGHEYRIYTKTETYVMKDSLIKGRFRTSNDYAALQAGHTYTCTKFGWRVPVFSMFQNIRDCHEDSARSSWSRTT